MKRKKPSYNSSIKEKTGHYKPSRNNMSSAETPAFYKDGEKNKEQLSSYGRVPIYGVHPVEHLIKDTKIPVQILYIQEGIVGKEREKIEVICQQKSILIQQQTKIALDKLTDGKNHQGFVALIKEQNFYQPISVLEKGNFVLILDHLEDPQNLGSILRTGDQFGVDGVIIPKNRSVGITSTVIKTSSGAGLFVPIIQESSLLYVVEKLKEYGYWIFSTSVEKGENIKNIDWTDKVAVIMGNESNGVSEQLIKKSDFLLKIPSGNKKHVDSLNVSVATGIIAYEFFTKTYKN